MRTVATLSFGLEENSRIKQKLNGRKYIDQDTILLAGLIDRLGYLIAGLGGGKKAPPSIVDELLGIGEEQDTEVMSFRSGAEFEIARESILSGG